MIQCRQYFSCWELLCDEFWSGGSRGCPSAIKQETAENCSPSLSCFPQVPLTALFSLSSFLFRKWEFLSFHCDLSVPFNRNGWNGLIAGKNTDSPGRPHKDGNLGPTMDSLPSTASSLFPWHNLLEQREESNRSQLAPSWLILKSWVRCLSFCLLSFLSSLGLRKLCFSLSPLSAPVDQ